MRLGTRAPTEVQLARRGGVIPEAFRDSRARPSARETSWSLLATRLGVVSVKDATLS